MSEENKQKYLGNVAEVTSIDDVASIFVKNQNQGIRQIPTETLKEGIYKDLPIDSNLSDSSTNAVQNKVVNKKISELEESYKADCNIAYIKNTVFGSPICITDSAKMPVQSLCAYGRNMYTGKASYKILGLENEIWEGEYLDEFNADKSYIYAYRDDTRFVVIIDTLLFAGITYYINFYTTDGGGIRLDFYDKNKSYATTLRSDMSDGEEISVEYTPTRDGYFAIWSDTVLGVENLYISTANGEYEQSPDTVDVKIIGTNVFECKPEQFICDSENIRVYEDESRIYISADDSGDILIDCTLKAGITYYIGAGDFRWYEGWKLDLYAVDTSGGRTHLFDFRNWLENGVDRIHIAYTPITDSKLTLSVNDEFEGYLADMYISIVDCSYEPYTVKQTATIDVATQTGWENLQLDYGTNTLVTGEDGFIQCTYIADPKMYIENIEKKHEEDIQTLKNAILSLGGNV